MTALAVGWAGCQRDAPADNSPPAASKAKPPASAAGDAPPEKGPDTPDGPRWPAIDLGPAANGLAPVSAEVGRTPGSPAWVLQTGHLEQWPGGKKYELKCDGPLCTPVEDLARGDAATADARLASGADVTASTLLSVASKVENAQRTVRAVGTVSGQPVEFAFRTDADADVIRRAEALRIDSRRFDAKAEGGPGQPPPDLVAATSANASSYRVRGSSVSLAEACGGTPAKVALRRQLKRVSRCYQDATGAGYTYQGPGEIKFSVRPDGSVANIALEGAEAPPPSFLACIERAVGTTELPPHNNSIETCRGTWKIRMDERVAPAQPKKRSGWASPLVVRLHANGSLFVQDDLVQPQRRVPGDSLESLAAAANDAKRPNRPAVVNADRDCAAKRVLPVLATLNANGFPAPRLAVVDPE